MPLKSFIDVPRESHFPIQNLPFGVFKPRDSAARVGVAIGERIVDLSVLEEKGHFDFAQDRQLFLQDSLNPFLALGRPAWRRTREVLQHLLSAEIPTLRDDAALCERVFDPDTPCNAPTPVASPGAVIGKTILFAREALVFPGDGPWLAELRQPSPIDSLPVFADIPSAGERIPAGRPILTLFARSGSIEACEEELRRRAADLDRWLFGA